MTYWFSPLTDPATVAGFGLLVLALLLWRQGSPASSRWLALALAAVYFTFATPLGANALVGLLEGEATPPAGCPSPSDASAFIVLAGGLSGMPASDTDVAHLKLASLRRVLGAVDLARQFPGSVLIMSGGGLASVREADLMASFARALGVDRSRISVEMKSRSTYESAVNVSSMLGSMPGREVFIVTSAMHMPRSMAVFRSLGAAACPHALDRRHIRPDLIDALLPQLSALDKGTAALHEFLGYAAYWITGRIQSATS